MTDEENRKLAEWMGWDYDPLGGILDDRQHPAWIMEDSSWIREEDWNPREFIHQAMMLLEKFPRWELKKRPNYYFCEIPGDEGLLFGGKGGTPEAAIVEAVMRVIEEGGKR